jgi:hypothetical protein
VVVNQGRGLHTGLAENGRRNPPLTDELRDNFCALPF